MTPSIGRIVHYVSYGTPKGEYKSECRAAIIIDINPVCLAVFNPSGMFFNTAVVQDEESKNGGSWHWPERVND